MSHQIYFSKTFFILPSKLKLMMESYIRRTDHLESDPDQMNGQSPF